MAMRARPNIRNPSPPTQGPSFRSRCAPNYNFDPCGSERGPVALPVFKIGRSPLTRGGWVRLPGASASLTTLRIADCGSQM